MEVGLNPSDVVLYKDPPPPPKKGAEPPSPNFRPMSIGPNGWIDQGATWYGGRPRPRRHCASWRPSSPPQKGHSPQFSAHVCCGQTVGWIKMPLGTKVGLGPGRIVLHGEGTQLPSQKGHSPINFGPCLLWPNGRPSQLLLSTC